MENNDQTKLMQAVEQLDHWLQVNDWKAYDPFDGLNAWFYPLIPGKLGRQILMQTVKRFPWNLRPILGIQPAMSSKGMGYLARAYLQLYQSTSEEEWAQKARFCLDWLRSHSSRGYTNFCWGNHFDYQSRMFYLPRGEPTVVWTAQIGHAFLDGWEILRESTYLKTAESICRFIMEDLERRRQRKGLCISYIATGYYAVHNANVLAAAMLARSAQYMDDRSYLETAYEAAVYTVESQRSDGSWWYGEQENLHWVDSFHTGYVLDSLIWIAKCTGSTAFNPSLKKGANFYVEHFFTSNGIAKFYSDCLYPIDIQCIGQGLETLSRLTCWLGLTCLGLAERVACWAVAHMQGSDGHFFFRRNRWTVDKTPMLHWGQATMMLGLAVLLNRRAQERCLFLAPQNGEVRRRRC